ncbi:recombination regulator RecX [Companilactobacillus nodensis DSM 19682 = JCM 14932 = NBRC 107160]|uniref:Regulatory protein RecX n=1 Tax=Companilactobacillus nodensis DSM 19682 = JCM 14932 = NBRC 107160 TaxID=1423775 RepID=A0A0R1KH15_9LACO|nr:recombination regulator RecX [Companilactobacillus nodensis]KRK79242.1 recombination regulator RecX [Companilactobacillus nodensis DSM 19682 = JCM 14932 = NBRC 107160]
MILAKVTKIQAQKRKGRYNVYLDGEYAFPVGETTLVDFRLMNGVELDDKQIKEIQSRENINKAYGDAVNYLSYQLRTEKEMRDYLYKKEYGSPVIYSVMERLAKLNYLDDEAYATSFINTQLNTTANGPRIIQQKMVQKGVPANIIEDKLAEVDEDRLLENATEFASKQVRKQRHKSFQQMMTKLKQSLYQKGYSGDIVSQAIDDLDLERDDDTEQENLVAMINKVQHRYDNPSKLINYLMTKGYRYDAIKRALSNED